MREIKVRTSQRPRPLPPGRWAMTQRWNDLLFAHWQMPAAQLGRLLPEGLQVDTFQGSAWLSVVPFWMDRINFRGVPSVPGTRSFPELNLRTYVRDQHDGGAGSLLFLAGCAESAGRRRRHGFSPALQVGGDAAGAAVGAGVCVLQPEAICQPAGHLQGALPGTGPDPQAGREPQRDS